MRRWGWRIGLPAVILFVPCCLGVWLCPLPPGAPPWRAAIQELLMGETPQARVAAYVRGIVAGDEDAALAVWELPQSGPLSQRRRDVTRQLMAAGISPRYLVLNVEWWRTCCEPGVIHDPRDAGGARLSVQFLDNNGSPLIYVFDVFHRGGSYWGAAQGYPARSWALYDVYPQEQEPLFWRLVYDPNVRRLDWPPVSTPTVEWP